MIPNLDLKCEFPGVEALHYLSFLITSIFKTGPRSEYDIHINFEEQNKCLSIREMEVPANVTSKMSFK